VMLLASVLLSVASYYSYICACVRVCEVAFAASMVQAVGTHDAFHIYHPGCWGTAGTNASRRCCAQNARHGRFRRAKTCSFSTLLTVIMPVGHKRSALALARVAAGMLFACRHA